MPLAGQQERLTIGEKLSLKSKRRVLKRKTATDPRLVDQIKTETPRDVQQ